jgi:hypothetical protein
MKKTIFILLAAVALSSCAELFYITSERIKNVQIGMSEDEVVRIMGRNYDVVGATATTRTLGYGVYDDGDRVAEYRLVFVNGVLDSFNKEFIYRPRRVEIELGE